MAGGCPTITYYQDTLWCVSSPSLFSHTSPFFLSHLPSSYTHTETFETIKEFVAPEFIPVEYGGLLKYSDEPDSCRRQSPEEVRMREFVLAVNKRHGVEMVKG